MRSGFAGPRRPRTGRRTRAGRWLAWATRSARLDRRPATARSPNRRALAGAGAPSRSGAIPAGVGRWPRPASPTTGAAALRAHPATRGARLRRLCPGQLVRGEPGPWRRRDISPGSTAAPRPCWPAYLRDGLERGGGPWPVPRPPRSSRPGGLGIPAGTCGGARASRGRASLTGEGSQARRAALALDPYATVVLLHRGWRPTRYRQLRPAAHGLARAACQLGDRRNGPAPWYGSRA